MRSYISTPCISFSDAVVRPDRRRTVTSCRVLDQLSGVGPTTGCWTNYRVLDDRSEHAGFTYILYQAVQYVYQLRISVSARIRRSVWANSLKITDFVSYQLVSDSYQLFKLFTHTIGHSADTS